MTNKEKRIEARQARVEESRRQATNALIASKKQIDDMLAKIQNSSDDHFGADPDTMNWGHTGTVQYVEQELAKITEFLNIK